MFAESSLTAVDPEVVALAERAAEFGCKAANSGPVVVSIVFGPGIETSGEISSSGMPLIAESTLCWSYHLGYVVPLGGHHHHQEDLINSLIYFSTLKSLFIYYLNPNPCTTR